MKYSLLAIVGLFAFGMVYVYSEEMTVQVPFDVVGWNCQSITETTYNCFFSGTGQIEVEDGVITVIPEEAIEETVEEVVDEPIIPEVTMTREEKDIARTIERIEQDLIDRPDKVPNADRQLLILLKRAQTECYFGIDQGQPIQAYALFGIPEGFLYIDETDFSKHNKLGKIAKLIEACRGWDKYRVSHLGQQYSDIADATQNAEIWRPTATLSSNVTNTAEYMNAVISKHDILEEEEDAAKFMCSIEGKQRGMCPSGIGEDVYVYDGSNNPALAKYLEYQADPENQVGEPKYSISTDPKCYTLESFSKQYDLDEESRRALLEAAGCRL